MTSSLPEAVRRRHLRITVATALLATAVIATIALNHRDELTATVNACIQWLRAAGPVVFFTAMAILPALGFPLMPLSLAAGPVFGPTMGVGPVVVCAIGAVMVNVAVSYWLAARAMHPLVSRVVAKLGYRLPEIGSSTAWHASLIVRLAPGLPFCVQSYVLGLIRTPFIPYLTVSVLVPAGYISGTILCGDALFRGQGKTAFFALGIVVFAGAIVHLLRKRQTKQASDVAQPTP